MQPVYLTEDGNYAIADNSSDDQENQENKALQKSRDEQWKFRMKKQVL